MPVDDVTIRGCLDDDKWSYRFTCPDCDLPTVEDTSVEPRHSTQSRSA